METYLVSLGSNENRAENMTRCRQLLKTYFQDIIYSEILETEPVGEGFNKLFYNCLAVINSDCEFGYIKQILKDIEKNMGRKPTDKSKGIVIIDLDVLAVNNSIIKSDDFSRPYISTLLLTFGIPNSLIYYDEYWKASVSI